MMITTKDIGKQCFIKFKLTGSSAYTWENVGAYIKGFSSSKDLVYVKMPEGELVPLDALDVRVLEPRPA